MTKTAFTAEQYTACIGKYVQRRLTADTGPAAATVRVRRVHNEPQPDVSPAARANLILIDLGADALVAGAVAGTDKGGGHGTAEG